MAYTVKELSEKMGVTQHTIRYYTDQGLLPCRRDKNNHRIFDEGAVSWLMGIQCLRKCNISIEDIQAYCRLCEEGDASIPARYEFMVKQRQRALDRLREAQKVADYMDKKVRHYEDILSRTIPDDTNLVSRSAHGASC